MVKSKAKDIQVVFSKEGNEPQAQVISPTSNEYKSIIVDEKTLNRNLNLVARHNLWMKREEFFNEVKENEIWEKESFKTDFQMKNLTARMDY